MNPPNVSRLTWWACLLALVALGLMTLSVLYHHPLALMLAMSVGQVLGTLSLLLFVFAVVSDLRTRWKGRSNGHPPPGSRSD